MSEWQKPPFVPGMKWWECSYRRDDGRYSISIPAATAEEAEALLHDQFGNGTVDGVLEGILPVSDEDAQRIARDRGRS